ncbi:MAG: hypothetical protein D3905_17160 [Candidatus Electrothrix sp. AS4_5]|nr:hypothetical protein [Candidatus Electrothrix gigas]
MVFFEYEKAEYRYQLGEEYRRNGFTRKAEEEWRICLEIRPDSKRCKKAAISGIEVETESASASLPY